MGITATSCSIYQKVRFAMHNRYYFAKRVILKSGFETVNNFR